MPAFHFILLPLAYTWYLVLSTSYKSSTNAVPGTLDCTKSVECVNYTAVVQRLVYSRDEAKQEGEVRVRT